jgi:hypothetical protein
MKRTITLTAAIFLLVGGFVYSQVSPYRGTLVRPLYSAVAADDTDVIAVFKYIGDQSLAATFQVTGDAAIFTQAGVADTDIPATCGGVAGTLDLTNAACDTVGEVLDIVNASTHWRMEALDSMRTDTLVATVTLDGAAQNAKNPDGVFMYWDTTGAALLHSRALVQCRVASCLFPGLGSNTEENPYKGTYTVLSNLRWLSTYGAGTSVIQIYGVVPSSTSSAETATLLWTSASGATTVAATLGPTNWPFGLIGPFDGKIIYRIQNDNSISVIQSQAYSLLFRY